MSNESDQQVMSTHDSPNSLPTRAAPGDLVNQSRLLAGSLPAHQSPCEELNSQILRWLLHYPIQRIEDIALGVQAIEQTIRRHVQTLSEAGLVEQVLFSRYGWFYLTDRGIHLAARLEGLDLVGATRIWQVDERSLLHLFPRFPMLLCVQNLINDLIQEAPASLAFQGRKASIRWCWKREYAVTFRSTKRHLVRCTADAAVVLRRSARHEPHALSPLEEYAVLLLYLDLGTASGWSRASITSRLRSLLLYRESQERLAYRSMFPSIVVLVESERQRERWQQAEQEATRSLRLGMPLAGVVVNITEQQKVSSRGADLSDNALPRSCWHYDWRDLHTNRSCHLQERLSPMTLGAIPPDILPQRKPYDQDQQAATKPDRDKERANAQHTRIVKGKFQERLPRLHLWPVSPAKEREMISLLGLVMGQRLRDLVQMVFAHPLTTAEELGWFLGLSKSTVERYLWTLEQWHCLEAFRWARKDDTKETRWKLSARGLRYLANSERLPLAQVLQGTPGESMWQPGVHILQKYLHHTAGVYWLLTVIHQAAQSNPMHQIVWFASHIQCAERYSYHGAWYNFRPDATVLYQWSTTEQRRRWLLWIEWDQGTMGVDQLRKKVKSYAQYMRSREWRRLGQSSGEPILVLVVPDQSQADRMISLTQQFLQGTGLQVSVTLRSSLTEQGFLAPIWFQAVPVPPEDAKLRFLFNLPEES